MIPPKTPTRRGGAVGEDGGHIKCRRHEPGEQQPGIKKNDVGWVEDPDGEAMPEAE